MRNKEIKNNEFFRDAGASPFVVDLKTTMQAREHEIFKNEKKNKFDLENFYEKLEGFNVKDKLKSWKGKAKQPISIDGKKIKKAAANIAKNSSPEIPYNENKIFPKYLFVLFNAPLCLKNACLIYGGKLKKIAVTPIKFIYKIFYNIGWTIAFVVRFFYFSFLTITKAVKSLFKNLYNYVLKPIWVMFRRSLSLWRAARLEKDAAKPSASISRINIIQAVKSKFIHRSLREGAAKKERRFVQLQLFKESKKSLKPTFAFAFVLVLLIIPFKAFTYYKSLDLNSLRGRVAGISENAIANLLQAGKSAGSMEFTEARNNFSQAAGRFLEAREELSPISDTLLKIASLIPDGNIKLASESKNILQAGKLAALLGENMSVAVDGLVKSGSIGAALENFIKYGESALVIANELAYSVGEINEENIPVEYRNRFVFAKNGIGFIAESLKELVGLAESGEIFMADNNFKRYLIVFQNNAEMRATGGFIGSYALLDVENGKIKNIEIPTGGSYDTEGGLTEAIIAPEPFHLINPLWHFWDANWWPDWPESSRKIEWFYERSGGPTVDGVIAITPVVFERLLETIGPIDMTEKYGVIITAENFWETTRTVIEKSDAKYKEAGSDASDNDAKPKVIIGDLTRKIIEEMPKRLNSREKILKLIKSFEQGLNEKHILFYFNNPELQSAAEEYGWDGGIRHSSLDYLLVVNSNIAGGKSDRKIKETITVEAKVNGDGSIINTVKIKREHSGLKFTDLTGVRNVDWMRIYVPLGSKLISATGFEKPDEIYFEKPDENWTIDKDVLKSEARAAVDELSETKIYEEAGKTVFANWSMADPGETAEIELKYRLPFKFQKKEPFMAGEIIRNVFNPGQKESYVYAMLAQKQAGSNSSINFNLILPEDMSVAWNYPPEINVSANGLRISDELNTDKYWAAIISK